MAEETKAKLRASYDSQTATSDLSVFAEDAGIAAEFVVECREHLTAMEEKLLLIEKNAADADSINAIFRAIHSIKGLAGFLSLPSIQEIAHAIETLLDHARSRRLVLTPPLVDALFEGIDCIRNQVNHVQARLDGDVAPIAASSAHVMLRLRELEASVHEPQAFSREDRARPIMTGQFSPEDDPRPPSAFSLIASGQPSEIHAEDASLRIETAKLDHLMDIVGELVVAQTRITKDPHVVAVKDPQLHAGLALLSRTTAEVQRVANSMRLVPIGSQFQKTARLVRDLSRQLSKDVILVTNGEHTELDKTIAAALADPLMHMVRNSIDHGIESSVERALAGKNPVAEIRLSASQQAAQIVIEVSDDGRGLDRDRILAKAIEHGLVLSNAQPSEDEIFQFIFEPGITTAEKITGVSGRGVGMDVVRRHVEKLRGRIDIHSVAGVGTTFLLRLPLSMTLIEGLTVAVGDNRYTVPIYVIAEVFCPSESQLSPADEVETVVLRGDRLPVVRLHRCFEIQPRSELLTDGILLVCEFQGRRLCLFVDEVVGKQEMVVKSLGDIFKDSAGVMGCAILADGQVGLIVDIASIMP